MATLSAIAKLFPNAAIKDGSAKLHSPADGPDSSGTYGKINRGIDVLCLCYILLIMRKEF